MRRLLVLAAAASWIGGPAWLVPRTCLAQPAAASAAPAAPPPPAPPEPTTAARTEAADRFDRGLRLFNAGDPAAALAEFKRAYALIPNPIVLYNIGLVYARLDRPVEATDALDQVLADPRGLNPERVTMARQTRAEQAARTAEITVTASVDGATLDVDGVEAATLPLEKPLRVKSGTHVVGVVAAGYAPLRKEVTIATGEAQALRFDSRRDAGPARAPRRQDAPARRGRLRRRAAHRQHAPRELGAADARLARDSSSVAWATRPPASS